MEYSENKKKAIEMLDKYATEHVLFNIKQSDNLEENIEIVLNLIEKQQKALEDSVSKEAIREYIKKLDEKLNNFGIKICDKKYYTFSHLKLEDKKLVEHILVQRETLKEILGE